MFINLSVSVEPYSRYHKLALSGITKIATFLRTCDHFRWKSQLVFVGSQLLLRSYPPGWMIFEKNKNQNLVHQFLNNGMSLFPGCVWCACARGSLWNWGNFTWKNPTTTTFPQQVTTNSFSYGQVHHSSSKRIFFISTPFPKKLIPKPHSNANSAKGIIMNELSLEVNVLNYVQMVAQTGRWKIVLQILHDKANWPRIFQGLEWKWRSLQHTTRIFFQGM